MSFEALQAQFIGQSQQLAVFQAQLRVLQGRINVSSDAGPQGLLAQRTVLDNQILKLQMDMAGTRAQLASRIGISAENLGPNGRPMQGRPDFPRRGPDPDIIVGMSFTLAIAVAFPLAVAYARRIWRGKPAASTETDTVAPRLDRLEQAVDAIAIEIERVAEGQRFVTKVLAERPAQAHGARGQRVTAGARRVERTRGRQALPRTRRRSDRTDPRGRTSSGSSIDNAALNGLSLPLLAPELRLATNKRGTTMPQMHADCTEM